MPDAPTKNPVLIPMPQGVGVNGVVSWALRLAGALADRRWPVGLVLHKEPIGHAPAGHELPPSVRVFDRRCDPPMRTPGQSLSPFVQAYRDALGALGWSEQRPAIVLPNLDAECFAIAAALSATHGDRMRVIGWQHSDTPFDAALLAAYEPMLAAVVGVSGLITESLRERLPWRAGEIHHIPYGVEVSQMLPPRGPGPIRLLYAGRLEHEQKRVGVLLRLAGVLEERGIAHQIRLVGDGPATAEVEIHLEKLPNASRLPPAGRDRMHEHLRWADCLVLASRYEGLSLSMLEAMAAGIAPVVTRVRSGAAEAVDDGVSGLLIDGQGDDHAVARRFADAIGSLTHEDLARLRTNAHVRAAERYGLAAHADACEGLFLDAIKNQPRWWPLERPCTFASSVASVPPDAAERAAGAIAGITGPIALYGAGRHTLAIANVLAHATIACVIDDDPKNHGKTLWGWPIVGLDDCPKDAVVLASSYMHHGAMAGRCRAAGLRCIDPYEHDATDPHTDPHRPPPPAHSPQAEHARATARS